MDLSGAFAHDNIPYAITELNNMLYNKAGHAVVGIEYHDVDAVSQSEQTNADGFNTVIIAATDMNAAAILYVHAVTSNGGYFCKTHLFDCITYSEVQRQFAKNKQFPTNILITSSPSSSRRSVVVDQATMMAHPKKATIIPINRR